MTAVTVGTRPTFGLTTIVDVIAGFARRSINADQARRSLRPAFGALAEDIAVTSYLTTILCLVHEDTIDADIAAGDIWETAVAAQSANPDLEYLLNIDVE